MSVSTPGDRHRGRTDDAAERDRRNAGVSGTAVELRAAIAGERRALAAVLTDLPAHLWDAPTLCAGWRVREVVAHTTMPFRYSVARFAVEMLRARGDFARMADRCARRDAADLSTGDLLAALDGNVHHPWKPPGGGFEGALTHEVVHGLDYTVPLGIDRAVPEDTLRVVLRELGKSQAVKHFGVDLRGVELRADDIDWALGSGTPVTGAAQDLALVLAGRRLPGGRLRGRRSEQFVQS
jgi:uncharacterized protein (TIGR03083 family)